MTDGARGGESRTIGQLIEGILGERLSAVNESQRLLALWLMVNGERERAHTVSVYLNEPTGKRTLPRLVVYVDSNMCVVDFNASREVYLARLEGAGLRLEGIDFRLSKYAAQHRERQLEACAPKTEELPELSEEECSFIEELVREVPESLRASVSKAMYSSLRREKASNAQND